MQLFFLYISNFKYEYHVYNNYAYRMSISYINILKILGCVYIFD